MSWFLTRALSAFLMPPFSLLLTALAGLWLCRRRPVLGRWLAGLSLALLAVLSMKAVSDPLLGWLEEGALASSAEFSRAQAIVVLGGGVNENAPEYGGKPAPGGAALERVRFAARLHRLTGKPILVTGGNPGREGDSEAAVLKRCLEEDFGVPVRWVEPGSDNTTQNAVYSQALLAREGVGTVLLVTSAWHMPRARYAFERAGLQVIPAGTGFHRDALTWLDILPSSAALAGSTLFIHEAIGAAWYRLKG